MKHVNYVSASKRPYLNEVRVVVETYLPGGGWPNGEDYGSFRASVVTDYGIHVATYAYGLTDTVEMIRAWKGYLK